MPNYKHLCIMFPGAAGGNHIANMISTIDGFQKFFDSENYIDELVDRYENVYTRYTGNKQDKISSIHGTKVHFTKYNNLDHLKISEEKEKVLNNSQKNILMGHAHSFYEIIHVAKTFVDRKDCVWLVMTSPDISSLAGKRALEGEFGILPKEQYRLPTSIGRGVKLKETDGFTVDTDLFVTESGWEYLNETLTAKLGLELDIKTKRMHDLWVSNIRKIVEH